MVNSGHFKHGKDGLNLALSGMFERIGFFGLTGVFTLFLTQNHPDRYESTLEVYSFLTHWGVGFLLIGGLLGDFLLGKRNAALIGLCFSSLGVLFVSFNQPWSNLAWNCPSSLWFRHVYCKQKNPHFPCLFV